MRSSKDNSSYSSPYRRDGKSTVYFVRTEPTKTCMGILSVKNRE